MERRRLGRDGAERLAAIEALAELSISERRMLAGLADEAIAAPGEVIMQQGEPGYEFVMLEQGNADVVKDGERINTMGPGDSFGELAVIGDGAVRTASVIASSELRAIVLTAHFMREMSARMPAAGERIAADAKERRERDLRDGS